MLIDDLSATHRIDSQGTTRATSVLLALLIVGCERTAPPPRPTALAPAAFRDAAPEVSTPSTPDAAILSIAEVVAVPREPWYRDKSEHTEDCVPPLANSPQPHFPDPFRFCDPRAESFASPPTSAGLHFHYRYFSAQLTALQRQRSPGVCCYMVFEFPHE